MARRKRRAIKDCWCDLNRCKTTNNTISMNNYRHLFIKHDQIKQNHLYMVRNIKIIPTTKCIKARYYSVQYSQDLRKLHREILKSQNKVRAFADPIMFYTARCGPTDDFMPPPGILVFTITANNAPHWHENQSCIDEKYSSIDRTIAFNMPVL